MEIISKDEAKKRDLKYYFTGKPCKRGHVCQRYIGGHCVQCKKQQASAQHNARKDDPEYIKYHREYSAQWHKNNLDRRAEQGKSYRAKNKEKIAEYGKAYRAKNKEMIAERAKAYQAENKEKIAAQRKDWHKKHGRKYHRQYYRKRMRDDPGFRIKKALRARLRQALTRGFKSGSAIKDLGCSISELKAHLEAQFQDGMSWDSYGPQGWHIDHVVPFASFDLTDREQVKKVCHYSNLQPLWSDDNVKKGAKHPHD